MNRGAVFVDPGATGTDLCGGDWTGDIVSNVTVNTSVPGIYTNTFTATDARRDAGIVTRTIVVAAPQVTTLPATNVTDDAATLGHGQPKWRETVAWFEWCSVYEPRLCQQAPRHKAWAAAPEP